MSLKGCRGRGFTLPYVLVEGVRGGSLTGELGELFSRGSSGEWCLRTTSLATPEHVPTLVTWNTATYVIALVRVHGLDVQHLRMQIGGDEASGVCLNVFIVPMKSTPWHSSIWTKPNMPCATRGVC